MSDASQVGTYPIQISADCVNAWLQNINIPPVAGETKIKTVQFCQVEIQRVANQVLWNLRTSPSLSYTINLNCCAPAKNNYASTDPTIDLFLTIFNPLNINVEGESYVFSCNYLYSSYIENLPILRYHFLPETIPEASASSNFKTVHMTFTQGRNCYIPRLFSIQDLLSTVKVAPIPIPQKTPNTVMEGLYATTLASVNECDITIKVGGASIRAHGSTVLFQSQAKDYFTTAFTGRWKEKQNNEMSIPNVDPLAVKALIKYLYVESFDTSNFTLKQLVDLKKLAHQWCATKACNDINPHFVALFAFSKIEELFECYSEILLLESPWLENQVLTAILRYFNAVIDPYDVNPYILLFTCATETKNLILLRACCMLALFDPSKKLMEEFTLQIDTHNFPLLYKICCANEYEELLKILDEAKKFEKTLRSTYENVETTLSEEQVAGWTEIAKEEWKAQILKNHQKTLYQDVRESLKHDPELVKAAKAELIEAKKKEWEQEYKHQLELSKKEGLTAEIKKELEEGIRTSYKDTVLKINADGDYSQDTG